jgi:hypothetical protein
MKISELIIIRKLLYFTPDGSGSSASRIASSWSSNRFVRQQSLSYINPDAS